VTMVVCEPLQIEGGTGVIGLQARLARVGLQLGFAEAAKLCDVAIETIRRIEIGHPKVKEKTILKVRAAFEQAGVTFIDNGPEGPGVRIRLKSKARRKTK
jgi:hypothetical protein